MIIMIIIVGNEFYVFVLLAFDYFCLCFLWFVMFFLADCRNFSGL